MKLFSTVIFIEIGSKTQEIRQWKSLKLSYAERSREHFRLPTTIKHICVSSSESKAFTIFPLCLMPSQKCRIRPRDLKWRKHFQKLVCEEDFFPPDDSYSVVLFLSTFQTFLYWTPAVKEKCVLWRLSPSAVNYNVKQNETHILGAETTINQGSSRSYRSLHRLKFSTSMH